MSEIAGGRSDPVRLEVYVEAGCHACERARELAAYVREAHTGVDVRVVDIASGHRPGAVVATPTFLLNGHVFSLGNPRREQLDEAVRQARGGR